MSKNYLVLADPILSEAVASGHNFGQCFDRLIKANRAADQGVLREFECSIDLSG